jgi:hypothetical protein
MNTTRMLAPNLSIDPELVAVVRDWATHRDPRPAVAIEPRPDGQRVKMTYLGVETGVLFAWGARVARPSVEATLDRLYEVLSWRVIQPPA